MSLYKPSYEQALDIFLSTVGGPDAPLVLETARAVDSVAAAHVPAPAPFPRVDLSMRDGVAISGFEAGGRREPIRTGEPIPPWARTVVPEEQIVDGALPAAAELDGRPKVVHAGAEYQAGDLVVRRAEQIDHHHVAQLELLGVERIPVVRPLRVLILTYDGEPFASSVSTWLQGFIRLYGRADLEVATLHSTKNLAKCSSIPNQDLVILLSDSAPGRYAEIKTWIERSPADYESLFWKVALYPGRHVGFGRFCETPLLVLPDLFFKTVLTACAFLPPLFANWTGRELFYRPASWVELPEIHYPYPCLVPQQFAAERAGLEVFARPLKSSFSARWVSAAEGYAILERPPILDEQFQTTIIGRLRSPAS